MDRSFVAGSLVGIGIALMCVVRVELYAEHWKQHSLVPFVEDRIKGTKVMVEGSVVADPDLRDTTLHANIHVSKLNSHPVDGTLIAFFSTDTKIAYGQHIIVKGTLRVPDSFQTDGGNDFDYPHYLQAQGISAMLTSAKVISSTPAPTSLYGMLFGIKHAFNDSLERIFLPPLGPLLEGILLGERRGIPDNLNHAFIVASLVHIVVLSGHVFTIVADAVMRILSFLSKKLRYPLAAIFIVLFILMVGATTIALRAGIMAGIGMLARYFNRQTDALRALAAAFILMFFWNPPAVVWDTSFVLSVLATLGLILFSPYIRKLLFFMPERFELRDIATSTLSVQIFILPALLYYTGVLSYLALPANVLALPVLPWAMLCGFLAGVLGLVPGLAGLLLAFVPAFFAQLLLRWILCIAQMVEAIPHSSTLIHAFPLWTMLVCYVPLILVASWLAFRNVPQRATS